MSQSQERRFVRQLVRLEDDAWRLFWQSYAPPLLDFVRLALGWPAEQSEEIVQMTFVRCVQSIRTYDHDRGGLMGWLKAVARNEAHSLTRRDRRHRGNTSPPDVQPQVAAQLAEAIDCQPLPQELVQRQDVQAIVRGCLMRLPERQREVMILKYLDGLPVARIATRLELTDSAVESLLSRGREAFRQMLTGKMKIGEILE
jgi:RNA polymerase sigma-70 factor (ECF subfamily)